MLRVISVSNLLYGVESVVPKNLRVQTCQLPVELYGGPKATLANT